MTEPTKEFYLNLPKKRMSAGVIFLNSKNEILMVKPTYKEPWELPGGSTEYDESPREGALREIGEELGLSNVKLELVCVDYTNKRGDRTESLQFIFYGGVLDSETVKLIRLPLTELSTHEFKPLSEAKELVQDKNIKNSFPERLEASYNAIMNNQVVYLENGHQPD